MSYFFFGKLFDYTPEDISIIFEPNNILRSISKMKKEEIKNKEQREENESKTPQQEEEKKTEQTPKEECTNNSDSEESDEEKYNILNDKYLRLSAEYDNYRKRTLKERMELIKTAGEDILLSFLPVMDNIDRAKKSVDEASDMEGIKSGIELIHKSLQNFLKEKSVEEVEAIGKVFDTDLHEAVTKIPVQEEEQKGTVIDVIEKGYRLKDKILRYAKVVVGE